ncbi:hypothetical protein EJ08DRAFT_659089 [Tothia fuscella]|uniref:Arrestin C-terminal-like domain-containing protein n=1 Tax=Tothia fuscella TaxID=1048955 RepID=A0A9P4NUD4_9PEZI|nr:hypothetical protein EJ08DRAFT_659089 [Tothia fuscella]
MTTVHGYSPFDRSLTGYVQAQSERGRLYYLPEALHQVLNVEETPTPAVFQGRLLRPHRIHIARVLPEEAGKSGVKARSTVSIIFGKFGKLASSKDSAKKFLKSFISSSDASKPPKAPKAKDSQSPKKKSARPRPQSWAPGATPPPPARRRPTSTLWGDTKRRSFLGGRSETPASEPATMRPNLRHSIMGPVEGVTVPASQFGEPSPRNSISSFQGSTSSRLAEEKPLASGNGISVSIALAEPVLFLQGFEHGDLLANRSTAMLRGSLHLRVSKATKIKVVTLRFRGRATTKWPEGIPPKKTEYEETNTNMSHTWPFFNAQFPTSEAGPGADHVELFKTATSELTTPRNRSSLDILSRSTANSSNSNLTAKDLKRLSLQVNNSRSFGKGDSPTGGPTVAQKGYRTFQPGEYVYNFELPLDSHLPETIDVELGSVKYELEATVGRAGAFKNDLVGTKEVVVIRTPAEGSLEQVEPIAISRNWEDQLHYDIVISGKSFPLGAQVPIAFKLTPLAKVQCHRIKVFVTESIEYYCNNKRVQRTEPTRKVQLFEKRADGPATSTFPGSTMRIISGGGVPYDQRAAAARGEDITPPDPTNLLGNLMERNIGPLEMEFNVQLPSCVNMKEKDKQCKLHFDTTYTNIQVHHWIKIVMRLSKPDVNDPSKRRHFEISIDSPFHILSCQATQANTALPAYTSPETADPTAQLRQCGCPGAPARRNSPTSWLPTLSSLNGGSHNSTSSSSSQEPRPNSLVPTMSGGIQGLPRPQAAHIPGPTNPALSRPMHLIRAPSFNPPPFSEEDPPPPLQTPPPQYDTIASPSTGLADYFSRLSDAYDGSSDDEGGDGARTPTGSSRVEIPLTPGSERSSRSLDVVRNWPVIAPPSLSLPQRGAEGPGAAAPRLEV